MMMMTMMTPPGGTQPYSRGAAVEMLDQHGNTPLIVACQNGQGRIAKMCIRYGADPNAHNRKVGGAHRGARLSL